MPTCFLFVLSCCVHVPFALSVLALMVTLPCAFAALSLILSSTCSPAPLHAALLLQVLDWFGQFGYKIPFGVSIADYILDISLGEAGYSSSGLTGSAAIKEVYEAYESQFAGQVNQHKHAEGFSYQIKQEHENGAAVKLAALPVSTVSAAAGDGCTVHFAPGPVSVAANGGSGVDSVRQSRDQMLNPAQRSSADRKALGGDSSSSGGGGVASGSRDALQQEEGSGGWLRKNHVHHQGASYLEQLRVLAQVSA